jgi:hypothetical protein
VKSYILVTHVCPQAHGCLWLEAAHVQGARSDAVKLVMSLLKQDLISFCLLWGAAMCTCVAQRDQYLLRVGQLHVVFCLLVLPEFDTGSKEPQQSTVEVDAQDEQVLCQIHSSFPSAVP